MTIESINRSEKECVADKSPLKPEQLNMFRFSWQKNSTAYAAFLPIRDLPLKDYKLLWLIKMENMYYNIFPFSFKLE